MRVPLNLEHTLSVKMKIFILLILLVYCVYSEAVQHRTKTRNEKSQRDVYGMTEEIKKTIIEMLSGNFKVPRKDFTKAHNNAYMRIYRNPGKFAIKESSLSSKQSLLFDGKEVLCDEEIKPCVLSTYRKVKGAGSRKLFHRIHRDRTGISERKIQNILNQNPLHRCLNTRFNEQRPYKAVLANYPQEHVQIGG